MGGISLFVFFTFVTLVHASSFTDFKQPFHAQTRYPKVHRHEVERILRFFVDSVSTSNFLFLPIVILAILLIATRKGQEIKDFISRNPLPPRPTPPLSLVGWILLHSITPAVPSSGGVVVHGALKHFYAGPC